MSNSGNFGSLILAKTLKQSFFLLDTTVVAVVANQQSILQLGIYSANWLVTEVFSFLQKR